MQRLARVGDYIGSLAPKKLADLLVINAPADVMLVVVGGPLYGDPSLLVQVLPPLSKVGLKKGLTHETRA